MTRDRHLDPATYAEADTLIQTGLDLVRRGRAKSEGNTGLAEKYPDVAALPSTTTNSPQGVETHGAVIVCRAYAFDVSLNSEQRKAVREGREAGFGGFGYAWQMFRILLARHPGYCSPSELGSAIWNPKGEVGGNPSLASVYTTRKQVDNIISAIGLTVQSRRGLGYRLEELSAKPRSKRSRR